MGHQRVLQAVVGVALAFATTAHAAPGERVAVIDLGAAPGATADDIAAKLARAIAAAGFVPVGGAASAGAPGPGDDAGLASALAGRDIDADAAQLASALATAQRAFGELRCAEVAPAAQQAIGIAAARQAAGLAVPELTRAWTYALLCADREGQLDAAHQAANRLRAIGGGRPSEVPAAVWTKYPEVDAVANADLVELDIDADAPGAVIWIDFRRAGTAPLHVALPAGEHVIAAAAGTRRGWAAGTAVRTQRAIRVPLTEAAGPWHEVAARVASWGGKTPSPVELAWLFSRIHARVALIREGDAIAAWGQVGRSELPHVLGSDARGALGDVERVLAAAGERVRAWNDRAPDPDRPLLTEDDAPQPMRNRRPDDTVDKPTKWWVYAAIGAAAIAGGAIVLFHETGTDRQRVELHYP